MSVNVKRCIWAAILLLILVESHQQLPLVISITSLHCKPAWRSDSRLWPPEQLSLTEHWNLPAALPGAKTRQAAGGRCRTTGRWKEDPKQDSLSGGSPGREQGGCQREAQPAQACSKSRAAAGCSHSHTAASQPTCCSQCWAATAENNRREIIKATYYV